MPVAIRRSLSRAFVAPLLASALLASALLASTLPAQARPQPTTVISLNPLGLVIPFFDAEVEHVFSSNSSVGLGAWYLKVGSRRYTSLDVKYRLYPLERAPEGLSVSATVGYMHLSNSDIPCPSTATDCTPVRTAGDALSTGVELDHTWMFGASKRITVLVGGGVKRLYYTGGRVRGFGVAAPVLRFTIGHAF